MKTKELKKMKKTVVHVFVGLTINQSGEVLFTNRREEKLPEVNGLWELPGGKVNFGETPQEAVERETREETGFSVKAQALLPHPFVCRWQYPKHIQHTVIMCFKCELLGQISLQLKDHHVNEVKWIAVKDFNDYYFLPGVEYFLKKFNLLLIDRKASLKNNFCG